MPIKTVSNSDYLIGSASIIVVLVRQLKQTAIDISDFLGVFAS